MQFSKQCTINKNTHTHTRFLTRQSVIFAQCTINKNRQGFFFLTRQSVIFHTVVSIVSKDWVISQSSGIGDSSFFIQGWRGGSGRGGGVEEGDSIGEEWRVWSRFTLSVSRVRNVARSAWACLGMAGGMRVGEGDRVDDCFWISIVIDFVDWLPWSELRSFETSFSVLSIEVLCNE